MGLDMYAFTVPAEQVEGAGHTDVRLTDPAELYYWRKFNNLHGWMHRLYEEKGGTDHFNCTTVRLTEKDLDRLVREMNANPDEHLPPTEGFFFGSGEPLTNEDMEDIEAFVKKAKEAIANKQAVFYDSWW